MTTKFRTSTAYLSIPALLVSAAQDMACLTLHLSSGSNVTGYVLAASEQVVELLATKDADGSTAEYYAVEHVIGARFT